MEVVSTVYGSSDPAAVRSNDHKGWCEERTAVVFSGLLNSVSLVVTKDAGAIDPLSQTQLHLIVPAAFP